MKIVLVVTGLPSDLAPARSAFNVAFAKALEKRNHKVLFMYLRSIHPKRPIVKQTTNNTINTLEFSTYFPKTILNDFLIIKKLFVSGLNKYKSILEDVDVYHAIGGNAIDGGFIAANYFKKPLNSQFIGSDLNIHFDKLLKNKYFVKGVNYSKFLSFNSKALQYVFAEKYGESHPFKVLYRGIDLAQYSFNFTLTNTIKILYLGGFPGNEPNIKGGETLLDALSILKGKSLDMATEIKIGGPNSLERNDGNYSSEQLKVTFIGSISKEEVLNEMKAANIILIPSLNEGVPNVLYEALATGNVVVATNVGGIPEIIENKQLIQPGNAELLAHTLLEIINKTPESKMKVIALENRLIVEKLDYSKFVNGYIDIYKNIKKISDQQI